MGDASNSFLQTLFAGGVVVFLGKLVGLGVSFVSVVVIGRLLGPDGYGVIALGATLMTTTSTLVLLGMHNGIGRYLPRHDDIAHRRGILVSAFQIVVPTAVVAGAAVALFAEPIAVRFFDAPRLTSVLPIFGIAIPIVAIAKLSVGGIQGLQLSTPKVYIENLTAHGARFVLAVVVLLAGYRTIGIAWAYLFGHAAAAALGVYYLKRHTALFSQVETVLMRRELLTFSAPLVVSSVMANVLADIDTFLLGYFATTTDVGVYNVIYPLATMLTAVLTSFGFILMPVISELHANDQQPAMKRTYQIVTKWIFTVSFALFVLLFFFPDVAIRFTFGRNYLVGTSALSILAAGFFTHAIAGPNYKALTSIGETKLLMYDNVAAAVGNIALNLVLIPRYSFVGAAVATTVSYVALNFAYSVQLYRRTGIHPISAGLLRPALAITPIVGGLGLVVTMIRQVTFSQFVVLFGGFLVCYGVVFVRFGGIESEEIMLVSHAESRFGVDLDPLKSAARWLM